MQLYIYNKLVFFVMPLFLLLSACATTQQFDRAYHQIQSIALLEVENPEAYQLISNSEVSEGIWGLAGGLINMKKEQQESKPLEQIVNEYGFNFGRLITQELERHLRRANYDVVIIPRSDKKNTVSVDAYLDVQVKAMGYMYFTKGEYIPWINVAIILTATQNGKTLYFDEVNYGPEGSTLIAESRYILKGDDISLLFENNKERVIETLQVGTSAIAEQISIKLAH